jgi:hypothetical protein
MEDSTDQQILHDLELIDQVDRLSALYQLTDRLYRARSLENVYNAALDALTATLGCRRASMLLFNKDGVMDFVASRGLSRAYRDVVKGHTPWRAGDRDQKGSHASSKLHSRRDQAARPEWVVAFPVLLHVRRLVFLNKCIRRYTGLERLTLSSNTASEQSRVD